VEARTISATFHDRLPSLRLSLLVVFIFLTFTNFANLWLSVFYLCFAALLAFFSLERKLPRTVWVIFFGLLSLAFLTGLLSVQAMDPGITAPEILLRFARYEPEKYFPAEGMLLVRVVGVLKVTLAFLATSLLLRDRGDRRELHRAFEIIFRVLVLFWFVQFLFYHLTGIVIDPSGAGRFLGNSNEGLLFRATGFFNEPGTYANVMYSMAVIRFMMLRRRIDFWMKLLLLSLLGSFSLFGWFFAALLCVLFYSWRRKPRVELLAGGGLLALFMGPAAYEYYTYRLDREVESSYSLATKFWAYESWLDQGPWRQFLGNWGWNDCACLYNDSGLFFVLLNEFGLLALMAAVGFIIYNFLQGRRRLSGLLSGMLFLKMGFLQPLMGIFLAVYFFRWGGRRGAVSV
jgi:hypothetical protein